MSDRIQKVLANLGLGSRRAIEALISEGAVTVNGAVAKLGDKISGTEVVKISGRTVLPSEHASTACRVLMYHKVEGEVTTLEDPEGRPTVFDHLPLLKGSRWIYIGRLDLNTSGLLLFTTDGQLANNLMHPKMEIERVYAARVYGELSEEQIETLTTKVELEDGPAHFTKLVFAGGSGRNNWYHCTLKEGRKREVRRLFEALGLQVARLIRIQYADLKLDPSLKAGQFRELSVAEINSLRKVAMLAPLDESNTPSAPLVPKTASQQRPYRQTQSRANLPAHRVGKVKRDERERRFEREVFSKGSDGRRRGPQRRSVRKP
ncbi:MAG: pseudouridine synthase [Succinivibrio sp.]|nr:pseudouridine synthase [Succinivibrio sp.]